MFSFLLCSTSILLSGNCGFWKPTQILHADCCLVLRDWCELSVVYMSVSFLVTFVIHKSVILCLHIVNIVNYKLFFCCFQFMLIYKMWYLFSMQLLQNLSVGPEKVILRNQDFFTDYDIKILTENEVQFLVLFSKTFVLDMMHILWIKLTFDP